MLRLRESYKTSSDAAAQFFEKENGNGRNFLVWSDGKIVLSLMIQFKGVPLERNKVFLSSFGSEKSNIRMLAPNLT